MPAIVRVKRRIDEEPLSAFVLNGKKRRLEDGYTAAVNAQTSVLGAVGGCVKEDVSTVLKFAGTLVNQDDNATTQFARLTKEKAKDLIQQKTRRSTNATEKARQNCRQSAQENRFKIVNCMRTILADTNADTATGSGSGAELTIVDIERQHTNNSNNKKEDNTNRLNDEKSSTSNISPVTLSNSTATSLTQPTDSDTGYVYDLYLPENEQQADYVDMMDDNYLSVRPFDDFFYEDRFNDVDDDDYDSEDSNEENHFGNDYPDEELDVGNSDDEESEGEREARQAIEKFVLGDDDEDIAAGFADSSDDEECVEYQDPYVHTVDRDDDDVDDSFAYDVDLSDVERYGMAYARYKKRIMKSLNKSQCSDSDDDDIDNSDNDRYLSASEQDGDE